MGRLIYSALVSLDGYIEDESGGFEWAEPDEEVHSAVNDLSRRVGTFLLGRRMYEVLRVWDTLGGPDDPAPIRDFGEVWRAADKVVYSTTLSDVDAPRTRVAGAFGAKEVRRARSQDPRDFAIGGPALAAQAFAHGLVDECHLFVAPVLVGGGKRALPSGHRVDLELRDHRCFDSGFAYLGYSVLA